MIEWIAIGIGIIAIIYTAVKEGPSVKVPAVAKVVKTEYIVDEDRATELVMKIVDDALDYEGFSGYGRPSPTRNTSSRLEAHIKQISNAKHYEWMRTDVQRAITPILQQVQSEDFIDSVVDRIQRKQLGGKR